MKNIFLSLAVLATGVAAQAQEGFGFKEGDILLEGSFQLNSAKESVEIEGVNNSVKESTILFAPNSSGLTLVSLSFSVEKCSKSDKPKLIAILGVTK